MPGIYLHIPYCNRKCHYCDFYSVTNLNDTGSFTDAICKEIQLQSNIRSIKADTVFIGGGTPSLLKNSELSQIFDALNKYFGLSDVKEFTIECNPGTVNSDKLKHYHELGINRISFGVQSFIESELKFLQRIHSSDEATNSVRLAQSAGLENINIDLIFSIPGQTLESLDYTLEKTIELDINHVSAYSLIYEKNTPLYLEMIKGKVLVTDEEIEADMYIKLIETLEKVGLHQYEISNFSKVGKECLHNNNYWNGGDYLAFGPSAHAYYSETRYKNFSSLIKYINFLKKGLLPVESEEKITKEIKFTERVMLSLRSKGLDLELLEYEFGIKPGPDLINLINGFESLGYLKFRNNRYISLTRNGFMISDSIISEIVNNLETRLQKTL